MNKQPKWTKNRRQRREQAKAVPWKPSPGPIVGIDFEAPLPGTIIMISGGGRNVGKTAAMLAALPRDKDGRIVGMHMLTNGQMIGRGERAPKMTKLDRQLKYGLFEAPDAGLKRYLRA